MVGWKLNAEVGEGLCLQPGVSTHEERGRHATGAHRRGTGKLQVQPKKQLHCKLREFYIKYLLKRGMKL